MSQWEAFLANQRRVELDIAAQGELLAREGSVVDERLVDRIRGCAVVFRHHANHANAIAVTATGLARTLGVGNALAYTTEQLHTTVVFSRFEYAIDDPAVHRLLDGVRAHTARVYRTFRLQDIGIALGRWLANRETALVTGTPTPAWVAMMDEMLATCRGLPETDFRVKWGAHATALRFTRMLPAKAFGEFCDVLATAPVLGRAPPRAIDVVTYAFDASSLQMTVHERFTF